MTSHEKKANTKKRDEPKHFHVGGKSIPATIVILGGVGAEKAEDCCRPRVRLAGDVFSLVKCNR